MAMQTLASFWSVNTFGCWMIVLFPVAALACTIVHLLAVMSPRAVPASVQIPALVLTLLFAFVAVVTIKEAVASTVPVRGNQIILMITVPPTVLGALSLLRLLKR